MSEPFLGEIKIVGFNFAPRSWAKCDGQLLAISQNSALFSLLGTMYGGDGRTTFGLPDLRGRVPIHPGTGPGLSSYSLGQAGGSETVSHAHVAGSGVHGHELVGGTSGSAIAQTTVSPGGGDGAESISSIQPYQCVQFIIALTGIFPPRP